MLKICLLVSGQLGYNILNQIYEKENYALSSVFTNIKSKVIIKFCQEKNIPLFVGNPRNKKAQDFLKNILSDILLSVNYLFIIEKDLIQHPLKYAINIHGSLLPKYRGRTPHVWAIINGEEVVGITAHLIDEEVDNGDIIEQIEVKIEKDDTGADILEKYNLMYPKLVTKVLYQLQSDSIQFRKQNIALATYFGKRMPKDGLINWNWSKERIRNWIRAQAKPYPGAFTYLEKNKIIINKATYCNLGFNFGDENGKILKYSEEGVYVKTPNGCLFLTNLEYENNIEIKIGNVLK